MPKLALFIRQDRTFANDTAEDLPCDAKDAFSVVRHIGEQVLIANIGPAFDRGYFALGKLNHLRQAGETAIASISEIQTFPDVVATLSSGQREGQIDELSDDVFEAIITQAIGAGGAYEALSHATFVTRDRFSTELASRYDDRCSFSKSQTPDGTAVIIRPLDHGGKWHVSNFLYLDPEPGELFARFAWTVGPRFEIIIDTHAMTADVSETVNRTGLLALPENADHWPDRIALAWHFEQFTRRVASGRG